MLKTAIATIAVRLISRDRLRQASHQDLSAPEKAAIPVTGGRMAKECKERGSSLQLTGFENDWTIAEFRSPNPANDV